MRLVIHKGRIRGVNRSPADRILTFPKNWDFFVIRFATCQNKEVVLGEHDLEVVKESERPNKQILTYLWKSPDGGCLTAYLSAEFVDPEVLLQLEVVNDTGLKIVTIDFPRFPISNITSEHALYLATPWGSRNYDPVKFLYTNYDGEVFRRYPADLAMQYTMVGNGNDLYYLSAYHTGDETFEVRCKVLDSKTICIMNRWYPFLDRGRWISPTNSIAYLEGEWHVGADLYRAHMGNIFNPPERHIWIDENFHGWVQVGLKFEGKLPAYRFTDIPRLYNYISDIGFSVMHVYGWSGWAFDTMYPDFDINPELGTLEDLRFALDSVKSVGGRVQLYTNGRLVDPNSRFFKTTGGSSIIIGEDGKPPTEQYGTSVVFYIACPSSAQYQSYFREQLRHIVLDIGAHAVQIDQISCNPSYLCYSDKHNHSKPSNNWLPGIEQFLKDLRDMYRRINPEFWVWVEGMNERFGQYYDINQGQYATPPWNIGDPFPEQFKYTYPNYIVTNPSNSIPQICHSLAQGKPFDVYLEKLEDLQIRTLLRSLIQLRKAEAKYFRYGEFKDTVGLTIQSEGIEGRVIKGDAGSLVVLWNQITSDTPNVACIGGDVIEGKPRTIYPKNIAISSKDSQLLVSWLGPIACIAFE